MCKVMKQVLSEAGIQPIPVLQTVHLQTKLKQIINPSLRTTSQYNDWAFADH